MGEEGKNTDENLCVDLFTKIKNTDRFSRLCFNHTYNCTNYIIIKGYRQGTQKDTKRTFSRYNQNAKIC